MVVACNVVAGDRGVRLAMPLAEAAALARHGGECLILPHDPVADLAALARLAGHCERFSPIVGWKTVEGPKSGHPRSGSIQCLKSSTDMGYGTWNIELCGPDCLFLDITGIGVLFGGEENLAREAIADSARWGYEARVATADAVGAAWAGATRSSSKFKVQSSKPGFGGLEPTWNLESLRLPHETVGLLSQLGIVQLDQLLALPRESLRARFGERLLLRIDQLLGVAQEMIVPYRPPPQFVSEWLLEYPVEHRETIEQIIHELIRRVASALAGRREGVLKLNCRLDCAPGRPLLLEVGLFRPSADAMHLWDLVRTQLEQATLPGPAGRVRLEATLTAPLENRQAALFTGGGGEAARQFALLIDRCSSRLGPEAVLRPEFTSDLLPERAVKYKIGIRSRKTEAKRARRAERGTQNSLHSALRTPRSALLRPLFLHSPPQLLEVLSVAPDGPPVSFRLQGRLYHIVQRWGPERIETGWWRGKSVRRDYWRVETDTGQRFWLFRQLTGGPWFLHGEFA